MRWVRVVAVDYLEGGGVSVLMSWIFLAAALCALPDGVAERLEGRLGGRRRNAKSPRDGPGVPLGVVARCLQRTRGQGSKVDAHALAADIDLFAAALRAGLSVQHAVSAVALAADEGTARHWRQVATLLSVGVSVERAWADCVEIPGLRDIASLVVMSGQSGAAIASGCARITDTLRADAAASATAAAERAGVFISLPLAVCFLPAFIILGLAPVVISLGSELL